VAKGGSYRAIVWTTYEGRVYGKVLEADLSFPTDADGEAAEE